MSSPRFKAVGLDTARGPFGAEARELVDKLDATGVVLLVLGSAKRGSGSCFELKVTDQAQAKKLALNMVELLRDIADQLQAKIKEGFPSDTDQYN